MTRGLLLSALAAALAAVAARPAAACPFCNTQGQTLAGELSSADVILVGTLESSERDPNDFNVGTAVVTIKEVVKKHPAFAEQKKVTLRRFIPATKDNPHPQLLLFCELVPPANTAPLSTVASALVFAAPKGATLDAYRGDEIKPESKLPEYLKATQAMKEKDAATRLRFYFDHLESNELFISSDALMEFGNATYPEVRPVAEKLPPDVLLKWLKDPSTNPSRYGLYGYLLGHCGKPEHAAAIRALIDDPDSVFSSGLDGLLTGYILLDKKAGWTYLQGIATDEKRDFTTRSAALRTLRFFHDYRADVLDKKDLLALVKRMCEQKSLADMPVEDLRKWGQWDETPFVLALADKPEFRKSPIILRSVLRFALHAEATGNADAAAFVAKQREAKPTWVSDAEEVLWTEVPKPAKTGAVSSPMK